MDSHKGISRQAYLSMVSYFFIIVFRSDSLLGALAAVVAILAVQAAMYLILPPFSKAVPNALFPSVTTVIAVALGALIYRLYGFFPLGGASEARAPFPNSSFLLLLVPLFVDQAVRREEYAPRRVGIQFGLFTAMIIPVAFIRETLGFGSLFGKRLFPSDTGPFPLLPHAAGAAFLVLLFLLPVLGIYRKITGTSMVLSVADPGHPDPGQPLLDREEELHRLKGAVLVIIPLAAAMLIFYPICIFVLSSALGYDLLLLLGVILLGVLSGITYLLAGRYRDALASAMKTSVLLPAQAAVLLQPCILSLPGLAKNMGAVGIIGAILSYLICVWILAAGILLFRRTVKRKFLFGKRPDIMTGIPFFILIAGLCLLAAAGISSIPETMFRIAIS